MFIFLLLICVAFLTIACESTIISIQVLIFLKERILGEKMQGNLGGKRQQNFTEEDT